MKVPLCEPSQLTSLISGNQTSRLIFTQTMLRIYRETISQYRTTCQHQWCTSERVPWRGKLAYSRPHGSPRIGSDSPTVGTVHNARITMRFYSTSNDRSHTKPNCSLPQVSNVWPRAATVSPLPVNISDARHLDFELRYSDWFSNVAFGSLKIRIAVSIDERRSWKV
ncbi:hypothetical protein L218DRAFT_608577 [Marasmius fiardii PR-910]|nr:hypothetical protein L218DRAFT_608577 [Marasmius fiardii PR-910]